VGDQNEVLGDACQRPKAFVGLGKEGETAIAVWFLISDTHRGQQWTPALTLPQVRYGLSVLLLETFLTLGVSSICRRVQRQCMRNELARFDHHRTRKCLPPRQ
jgi:hypothetical protein